MAQRTPTAEAARARGSAAGALLVALFCAAGTAWAQPVTPAQEDSAELWYRYLEVGFLEGDAEPRTIAPHGSDE